MIRRFLSGIWWLHYPHKWMSIWTIAYTIIAHRQGYSWILFLPNCVKYTHQTGWCWVTEVTFCVALGPGDPRLQRLLLFAHFVAHLREKFRYQVRRVGLVQSVTEKGAATCVWIGGCSTGKAILRISCYYCSEGFLRFLPDFQDTLHGTYFGVINERCW